MSKHLAPIASSVSQMSTLQPLCEQTFSDNVGFDHPDVSLLMREVAAIAEHQNQLRQKVDVAYQDYMAVLGPAERELIELKIRQLDQLILFISDPELNEQEKQALIRWLQNDITDVSQHVFVLPEQAACLWQSLINASLLYWQQRGGIPDGFSLTTLQSLLAQLTGESARFDTPLLLELIAQPHLFPTWLAQYQQGKENKQVQRQGGEEKAIKSAHQAQYAIANKLFKNSHLTKMYKRLAKQLHPDKERDPQLKQSKRLLMQQLADAKKNRDLLALLQLYQQHGDSKVNLDLATSNAIALWLQQQGVQFSQSYQQTIAADTPKMWAWRRFQPDLQPLAPQLEQQLQALRQSQVQLKQFVAQINSPVQLRALLQQRKKNVFNGDI